MLGGVFASTHVTLEQLVMFAYGLMPYQIVGAPDWLRRDTFQLDARAGSDVGREQMNLMVQSLLEDRFKLVARRKTRDLPYRALVLVRHDGQLGSNIRHVDDNCTRAIAIAIMNQFPRLPETPGDLSTFGACQPLSALEGAMTGWLKEPVRDETGLTGKFVYTLRAASLSATLDSAVSAGAYVPALNEALATQLGVRLEQRRGPIELLVIDSAQKPTEN